MQQIVNNKKVICVVEDNIELLEALGLIIEMSEDYILGGLYSNAEDAIKEIPLIKPDAVLMDINLPSLSGIECTLYLKNLIPNIQVLICTSFEDGDKVFKSLKAGALGYILKTEGAIKIIQALKEMLNGGSPMSANIARKVITSFNAINSLTAIQLLTEKEKTILEHLSKGLMNKEVATTLSISMATVRTHIQNIYAKLHVNTRVEAVNLFLTR